MSNDDPEQQPSDEVGDAATRPANRTVTVNVDVNAAACIRWTLVGIAIIILAASGEIGLPLLLQWGITASKAAM